MIDLLFHDFEKVRETIESELLKSDDIKKELITNVAMAFLEMKKENEEHYERQFKKFLLCLEVEDIRWFSTQFGDELGYVIYCSNLLLKYLSSGEKVRFVRLPLDMFRVIESEDLQVVRTEELGMYQLVHFSYKEEPFTITLSRVGKQYFCKFNNIYTTIPRAYEYEFTDLICHFLLTLEQLKPETKWIFENKPLPRNRYEHNLFDVLPAYYTILRALECAEDQTIPVLTREIEQHRGSFILMELLWKSVEAGRAELVAKCILEGADAKKESLRTKGNILEFAINKNASVDVLQALIWGGANVNHANKNQHNMRPIHFVRDFASFQCLCAAGADVFAKDDHGETIFDHLSSLEKRFYMGKQTNLEFWEELIENVEKIENPSVQQEIKKQRLKLMMHH